MGTLLDALSQENLDNQREVVKNEKRWSYDNRPYGSWNEKLQAPPLPARASRTTTRRSARWRTSTRRRSRTSASSSGPTTRRTTRSCRSSATSTRPTVRALGRALLRRHPGEPATSRRSATCRCRRSSASERRETVHDKVPLPRVYFGFRAPVVRRPAARRPRHRRPGPRRRQGQRASIAGSSATSGSPRTSRSFALGFVGGASIAAGWATVRPGVAGRAGRGGAPRGARAARPRAGHATTSWRGPRADRDRGARRRSRGSRSGPTGCRCTRRCSTTRT